MEKKTLKELRARLMLTQEEFATAIEVSTPTYRNWEKDLSQAPIAKVYRIAQLCNVPITAIALTKDEI